MFSSQEASQLSTLSPVASPRPFLLNDLQIKVSHLLPPSEYANSPISLYLDRFLPLLSLLVRYLSSFCHTLQHGITHPSAWKQAQIRAEGVKRKVYFLFPAETIFFMSAKVLYHSGFGEIDRAGYFSSLQSLLTRLQSLSFLGRT